MKGISVDKILATLASFFILVDAIIISITPPATGYELTIYTAYPLVFWFLLVASITCGIIIIIRQAFSKEKTNLWLAGLFIVIVSNVIFLALPYFRGYAFFPLGDAMDHIGMMKDIMATGHIGIYNFYPMVHLIGVNLFYITGVSDRSLVMIIIISFEILYLLGVCALAKELTNNRRHSLFIIAFACPLIFSMFQVVIHPAMLSIFILPVLFLLYIKRQHYISNSREIIIVLILFALFITFMHPVTCIFVIVAFFAMGFSRLIYNRIVYRRGEIPIEKSLATGLFNIPIIMSCCFVAWYFSYSVIVHDFHRVYDFIINGSSISLYSTQVSQLALASLSVFQAIKLFILRYGAIFISASIALVSAFGLMITSVKRKDDSSSTFFSYSVLFFVGVAASAFSLFGLTGEVEPLRISRFFLLIAPIVTGLFVYRIFNKKNLGHYSNSVKVKSTIILISALIASMAIFCIFNVYGSPWTIEGNWQVTKMEIFGTSWFILHQDGRTPTASPGMALSQFVDFSYGEESNVLPPIVVDPLVVPSGFGYDTNNSISQFFNDKQGYLLTFDSVRIDVMIFPANVRTKAHDYGGAGFIKLGTDTSANEIYENFGLEIWRINT